MKKLITIFAYFLLSINIASAEHDHHEEEEHEAKLEITDEQLKRFGLTLEEAGARMISQGLSLSGRIVPIDEKIAHVSPRFSGVIKEVRAKVGDIVKGDTALAIVQNNQNLQTFPLFSAISGMVIKRHATLGETVVEESVLFIVADLSEVWAELAVYKNDVDKIHLGQKTIISTGAAKQEGEVVFFSPITEEQTQARLLRVKLKNNDLLFSPGAFISGTIVTEESKVKNAVSLDALQRIENEDVVFVRDGDHFEPRKVILGKRDGISAEVISGIKEGEKYAGGNTFILKAELGKGEAEHDH